MRVGLKQRGFGVPVKASEDADGRWSLYDYGGVVLHLFDDEGRRYFDLDALWVLEDLFVNIEGRTICALADAAVWPLRSIIRKFRHEFLAKMPGVSSTGVPSTGGPSAESVGAK